MLNVERHDVGQGPKTDSETERESNSVRRRAFAASSCGRMSFTALLEHSGPRVQQRESREKGGGYHDGFRSCRGESFSEIGS